MGRRIASESKQTVRGGPKPAKVGLHRRLVRAVVRATIIQSESNIFLSNQNPIFSFSREYVVLITSFMIDTMTS